eukprot:CAMPEP_0198672120 /NCGR_PEP_ID=MMETSP1467-20131203/89540_1 /TAXON_ID=1462469 /ORGANISM="unid. sp., Strain CCMP2135" /LENGTH=51 /DNA_ID=CAMNT_0044408951 /DNA_START=18 /DNA_END=169 /DNA_ORIENTATION=-
MFFNQARRRQKESPPAVKQTTLTKKKGNKETVAEYIRENDFEAREPTLEAG